MRANRLPLALRDLVDAFHGLKAMEADDEDSAIEVYLPGPMFKAARAVIESHYGRMMPVATERRGDVLRAAGVVLVDRDAAKFDGGHDDDGADAEP